MGSYAPLSNPDIDRTIFDEERRILYGSTLGLKMGSPMSCESSKYTPSSLSS